MIDKDKLIIVYYADVRHIDNNDIGIFLVEIRDYLSKYFDDSIKLIIIPNTFNKIEVINPVYITSEDINNRIENIIDNLENKLNLK